MDENNQASTSGKVDSMPGDFDIFGAKAMAKVLDKTVDRTLDGAGPIIKQLVGPASKELGLYFEDKVRAWRANHAAAILAKAQPRLPVATTDQPIAKPAVVLQLLDAASFADDDVIQSMWAGLLGTVHTKSICM